MALDRAVIEGAEAWSSPGEGANGRLGIAVVHGFTGNPCSMRPLGEALAAHGYAVEVVRLPGHGTTAQDMATTRYPDWRGHVVEVLEDLAGRTDHRIVVGLSMGGTIALDLLGADHPTLDGAVVVNSTILNRDGLLARLAPYLARILPMVPAKAAGLVENDIAKPGGDEKAYDKVPAHAANSLLAELPRIRARLLDLRKPLTVAYSPQDHSVPPENSRRLLELANGSRDLRELVLERSFHVATLDWDADHIEQAAVDMLDGLAGRG